MPHVVVALRGGRPFVPSISGNHNRGNGETTAVGGSNCMHEMLSRQTRRDVIVTGGEKESSQRKKKQQQQHYYFWYVPSSFPFLSGNAFLSKGHIGPEGGPRG
jgi:hypothetical protein